MSTVNVNVQPTIISWALSQTDEGKLGAKLLKNIKQWLEGTKTPTFKQIEDFSRKANIPLGYFFLQTPTDEKIELLEYRTIDSVELAKPSRDLIDTINEMERVQDWMREYRQDTGFDVLPLVGSLKELTESKQIAERIREDLGLEIDWFSNCKSMTDSFDFIRGRLENNGVVVMLNGIVGKNNHRTLSVDEFRAFAMVDEWAPLIFINSVDSQGAKIFSLFHEIAHIWIGVNDLYNDRRNSASVKPLETLCNAVASELLVPVELFEDKWINCDEQGEKERIRLLAKIFRCGEIVIARKALDANRINKEMYDEIVIEVIEAYRITKENKETNGGNYYNTVKTRLDGNFVRAICESIATGRTTFTEAYRLTNTSRKTFPEVTMRLGGVI